MLLFPTFARATLKTENALLATKDTTLKKENASSANLTTPSLQIWDVELGTGIAKFALNALTTGFSMLIRSVCQFLTNAKLTLRMETARAAITDMT